MARNYVERLRGLVMFVVAWLIGLYIFEVVREASGSSVGLAAAVLTVAVNIYARKRAAACVQATPAFKFWLYLPVALFLLVPVAVKVIVFLKTDANRSWWEHLISLLPFILKLGVPVAVLLWVYVSMGKLGKQDGQGAVPIERSHGSVDER